MLYQILPYKKIHKLQLNITTASYLPFGTFHYTGPPKGHFVEHTNWRIGQKRPLCVEL